MGIKKTVHVGDPAQPPQIGFITAAKIKIRNQMQISLEGDEQPKQSWKIVIHEPRRLGLKSSDQLNRHDFFNRVLTTCNLLLTDIRLSTDTTDTAPMEVSIDKQPSSVTRDGIAIVVSDRIVVRDWAEIGLHYHDELDEAYILEVLGMLHKVYDAKDPPATVGNIRESLKMYSRGITARDREEVFKGLFVALEKAAGKSTGHNIRGNMEVMGTSSSEW